MAQQDITVYVYSYMLNRDGSIPSDFPDVDIVRCTDHMCPLRIHWHIKNNYMDHWRVKLTVSNYNYRKNYSDWNILVQHPGFGRPASVYSFDSTMLPVIGVPGTLILEKLIYGVSNGQHEHICLLV